MRSPRTSLSSLLSTCSTMGIGGVASGTQLISGIAGVDMPVVFNDKCPWLSVQKL